MIFFFWRWGFLLALSVVWRRLWMPFTLNTVSTIQWHAWAHHCLYLFCCCCFVCGCVCARSLENMVCQARQLKGSPATECNNLRIQHASESINGRPNKKNALVKINRIKITNNFNRIMWLYFIALACGNKRRKAWWDFYWELHTYSNVHRAMGTHTQFIHGHLKATIMNQTLPKFIGNRAYVVLYSPLPSFSTLNSTFFIFFCGKLLWKWECFISNPNRIAYLK